jgi:adenosylcobyric acid synthase
MHMGRTGGIALLSPMLDLGGRPDGAVSANGRIMGCHLHGLFAADRFRHAFLARLRPRSASGIGYEAQVEATLDALACHLERALDTARLLELAGAGHGSRSGEACLIGGP